MHRFAGDRAHDQEVEGTLDEVGGFGHVALGYLQETMAGVL
jgi:hypothetical protein